MNKFLSCTNMTGGYGGEDIIHGCDIEVDRNQIVVIVGPNGAGKSTAMKAMLGMISLKEGSLKLDGVDISILAESFVEGDTIQFMASGNNPKGAKFLWDFVPISKTNDMFDM